MDKIDKSIEEYNAIYNNVYKIVIEKLTNLNSAQRSKVGGSEVYYKGLRPSMTVLYKINKRINELNKKENK